MDRVISVALSRSWCVALSLLATLGLMAAAGFGGVASAVGPAAGVRPYEATGTVIDGGVSADQAPALVPGRYVDDFDTIEELSTDGTGGKFYRVRLRAGETPYLSATEVPPGRADTGSFSSLAVAMALRPLGGDSSCSFTETQNQNSDGTLNTVTGVLAPGLVGGPDWDEDCPTDAEYAVQVMRTGDAYEGTSIKTEIAFRIEPKVTSTAGVPAPQIAGRNLVARASGTSTTPIPAKDADSFDDAPLLSEGQYSDEFTTGETRYYRVHLDWGQRLAYTVTVEQNADVDSFSGVGGQAVVTNPLRQTVAQPDRASKSADGLGEAIKTLSGSTTVPVRYTNRGADDPDTQLYAVDGDYYLALHTDYPSSSDAPFTVGFTVVIDVRGRKETGPVYLRGGPPDSSGAPSDDGGSVTLVVLAAGGGVVLVLALLGVLVVRRRSARRRAVPYPGASPYPGPPHQTMPLRQPR